MTSRVEKKGNGFMVSIDVDGHEVSILIDCNACSAKTLSSKYELTKETKKLPNGTSVYRIRALRDIPEIGVRMGDLGGWIQGERNLSHEGTCWVGEDAIVYGQAQIFGNAQAYGQAQIYGHAQIFGCARVYGNAFICERAKVYGEAMVYSSAILTEDSHVYSGRYA